MERPRVLFLTERSERHQQAALRAAPPELDVTLRWRAPRADVVRLLSSGVDFLISERQGTVDAEMVRAGQRLRLIQRLGSLAYDIDLQAARAAGIPVCILPLAGPMRVAEHMLWQMLTLVKRLGEAMAIAHAAGDWGPPRRTDENTFAYNWSRRPDIGGLHGLTVGILGFGEIGAELARRLAGWGLQRLLYHKRRRLPAEAEAALGLTYAAPDDLLAASDIVCHLLPYAPDTDGLLNAAALARMKAGALLVGCGSGGVVDEVALAAALRAGHLAGAALDTFAWEPLPPDNPLLPLARDPARNVLLTPHVAAGSPTAAKSTALYYDNIGRVLRGDALVHRIA